ncbi:hypothetical protein [Xaviernesmea oryzae]|uniref:hypothetical protein n=1 Tax=Xaviernesmea oryzae TaxID=464029 RepID=UPI000A910C4B|nr:hypothetical protein [Xaviernesmea oryzae]
MALPSIRMAFDVEKVQAQGRKGQPDPDRRQAIIRAPHVIAALKNRLSIMC